MRARKTRNGSSFAGVLTGGGGLRAPSAASWYKETPEDNKMSSFGSTMTCKGCTAQGITHTRTHAHRTEAPPLSSAISLSAGQKNCAVFFGCCSNFITDSIQSFLVRHKVNTMNADPPLRLHPPPPPPLLPFFFFFLLCPLTSRRRPETCRGRWKRDAAAIFCFPNVKICRVFLLYKQCLSAIKKKKDPSRIASHKLGARRGPRQGTDLGLRLIFLCLCFCCKYL